MVGGFTLNAQGQFSIGGLGHLSALVADDDAAAQARAYAAAHEVYPGVTILGFNTFNGEVGTTSGESIQMPVPSG